MTTKVTVDAHAGWPVEVVIKLGEPYQLKTLEIIVVNPNTVRDFYVHSGMEILSIKELER